jgi:hypothetical protein
MATEIARLNNGKNHSYSDVPKIELSKIDNVPYYIESIFVH